MGKILSVSIAAYNVETTLREALDSFTDAAVASKVDVMIIDDGSSDKTADIAREYEKNYAGTFRLISKVNGGWGSTLNTGFEYAEGKYFKQLDGDDYYSKENLPTFLEFLENTDADIIHSPFVTFNDANGALMQILGGFEGSYRCFLQSGTVPLADCTQYVPAMHALTVRTKILKESDIKITEHCFYTDVEFILKVFNCSNTMAFFERPVYYYRLARSGQSMSLAGVRKHYKDHQKMLTTMLKYYKDRVTDPTKKMIFEQRLASACDMQYVFYFALKSTRAHKAELRAFDKMLKETYPAFYVKASGNLIHLSRRYNFTPYFLFCKLKMRKDRRERKNIFEGEA